MAVGTGNGGRESGGIGGTGSGDFIYPDWWAPEDPSGEGLEEQFGPDFYDWWQSNWQDWPAAPPSTPPPTQEGIELDPEQTIYRPSWWQDLMPDPQMFYNEETDSWDWTNTTGGEAWQNWGEEFGIGDFGQDWTWHVDVDGDPMVTMLGDNGLPDWTETYLFNAQGWGVNSDEAIQMLIQDMGMSSFGPQSSNPEDWWGFNPEDYGVSAEDFDWSNAPGYSDWNLSAFDHDGDGIVGGGEEWWAWMDEMNDFNTNWEGNYIFGEGNYNLEENPWNLPIGEGWHLEELLDENGDPSGEWGWFNEHGGPMDSKILEIISGFSNVLMVSIDFADELGYNLDFQWGGQGWWDEDGNWTAFDGGNDNWDPTIVDLSQTGAGIGNFAWTDEYDDMLRPPRGWEQDVPDWISYWGLEDEYWNWEGNQYDFNGMGYVDVLDVLAAFEQGLNMDFIIDMVGYMGSNMNFFGDSDFEGDYYTDFMSQMGLPQWVSPENYDTYDEYLEAWDHNVGIWLNNFSDSIIGAMPEWWYEQNPYAPDDWLPGAISEEAWNWGQHGGDYWQPGEGGIPDFEGGDDVQIIPGAEGPRPPWITPDWGFGEQQFDIGDTDPLPPPHIVDLEDKPRPPAYQEIGEGTPAHPLPPVGPIPLENMWDEWVAEQMSGLEETLSPEEWWNYQNSLYDWVDQFGSEITPDIMENFELYDINGDGVVDTLDTTLFAMSPEAFDFTYEDMMDFIQAEHGLGLPELPPLPPRVPLPELPGVGEHPSIGQISAPPTEEELLAEGLPEIGGFQDEYFNWLQEQGLTDPDIIPGGWGPAGMEEWDPSWVGEVPGAGLGPDIWAGSGIDYDALEEYGVGIDAWIEYLESVLPYGGIQYANLEGLAQYLSDMYGNVPIGFLNQSGLMTEIQDWINTDHQWGFFEQGYEGDDHYGHPDFPEPPPEGFLPGTRPPVAHGFDADYSTWEGAVYDLNGDGIVDTNDMVIAETMGYGSDFTDAMNDFIIAGVDTTYIPEIEAGADFIDIGSGLAYEGIMPSDELPEGFGWNYDSNLNEWLPVDFLSLDFNGDGVVDSNDMVAAQQSGEYSDSFLAQLQEWVTSGAGADQGPPLGSIVDPPQYLEETPGLPEGIHGLPQYDLDLDLDLPNMPDWSDIPGLGGTGTGWEEGYVLGPPGMENQWFNPNQFIAFPEDSNLQWEYDDESGEWDLSQIDASQPPAGDWLDPGFTAEDWETSPWYSMGYSFDEWFSLPYEWQEYLLNMFPDLDVGDEGDPTPSVGMGFENPEWTAWWNNAYDHYVNYIAGEGGPYEGMSFNDWMNEGPHIPDDSFFTFNPEPEQYEIGVMPFNPYDADTMTDMFAMQMGWNPSGLTVGSGYGAGYLEGQFGEAWDPTMIGVWTPEMIEQTKYGYYAPMMEQAREQSVQGAMSQYGAGLSDVLNTAQYEDMLRSQIGAGTLAGYEQVAGLQQGAFGQAQGIMDEWSQLMSALQTYDD